MAAFKIIALSGVGRAGKDTFFRFAFEYLRNRSVTSARWAMADELKCDLDSFVKEKFNFSAFTEDREEKTKIRPLLVEYGRIRRNESGGSHWLNKIRDSLLAPEPHPQVRFITDIRFAEFGDADELGFVRKIGGSVIHIERRDLEGFEIPPCNDEERRNDPLIRREADVKFSWSTYEGGGQEKEGEQIARDQVQALFELYPEIWK